jgi:hypothetical protein
MGPAVAAPPSSVSLVRRVVAARSPDGNAARATVPPSAGAVDGQHLHPMPGPPSQEETEAHAYPFDAYTGNALPMEKYKASRNLKFADRPDRDKAPCARRDPLCDQPA